jgi:hypothetical protein
MTLRARCNWLHRLAWCIAIPATLLVSSEASGDEWLDRLNELAAPSPGEQDGTKILFDAVAAMDGPPDVLGANEKARQVIPGMPGWDELASWADAPAQQKVLEAVATITERKARYILGLPYSDEDASGAWRDAGLVINSDLDGLLLGTEMRYLDGMHLVFALHWVEMTRLAEAEDAAGSIDVMEKAVRLARILMERPTSAEVSFAHDMMLRTLEKILDTCRSVGGAFDATGYADLNRRFEERRLLMNRQELPMGDQEMAGQLVALGIEARSSADGVRLSRLMSGISGNPEARPLERFSRAAHWKTIAEQHGDWFETTDQLENLFGDWAARWALPDLKDPMHERLSDYRKMDKRRFLILEESLSGYEQIFTDRMNLFTALHGTTSAIAVLGFQARSDRFPPELTSVQPTFIKRLPVDPYFVMPIYRNVEREDISFTRWQKHDMFQYFVPIRDQTFGRREEPGPYKVSIELPGSGEASPGIDLPGEFDFDTPNLELIEAFDREVLSMLLTEGADWKPGDEIKGDRLAQIESIAFNQDDATSMQEDFQQMIDAGMTPDNFGERMTERLQEASGETGAGEPLMQFLHRAIEMSSQLGKMEYAKSIFDKVAAGSDLAPDDIKAYWIADTHAQFDQELFEEQLEVLELVRDTPFAMVLTADPDEVRLSMSSHLNVALDDSNFILYSVGPDLADNDAARCVTVGVEPKPAGTDILIYPSALSLQREQGGF